MRRLGDRAMTTAERSARWRANNSERAREVKREFYQRHRERVIQENIARKNADRAKPNAHEMVRRALISGRLKRGACERADSGDCLGRVEAHHSDYSKPLDVRWFCQRHHCSEHAKGV